MIITLENNIRSLTFKDQTEKVSLIGVYDKIIVKIPDHPDLKAKKLARSISISYDKDKLDGKTIAKFFEKSFDLMKKPFTNLIFPNRRGKYNVFFA